MGKEGTGYLLEGGLGGHCSYRARPSDCFFFSSYTGSRVTSNMAILEVPLLSGFVLAPRSRMLVRTLEGPICLLLLGTIHFRP